MFELVFATFLQLIKDSWKSGKRRISQADLINLLYDAVSIPTGLTNQNNDVLTVDKSVASKIFHRKKGGNINYSIQSHSNDKKVLETIELYFEENIIPYILEPKKEDLILKLRNIIENDSKIAEGTRTKLLISASKQLLAKFLSDVYIYSLSRENVVEEDMNGFHQLSFDEVQQRKRHHVPVQVPDVIQQEEANYISALIGIYQELEKISDFDLDSLQTYPKYEEHFKRQRKDYYAAESVRMSAREIYGENEESYFNDIIDDIYHGIIETWEDDFPTGMQRLKEVLKTAVLVPVSGFLQTDTEWISTEVKKGACHVLVNMGILKGWLNNG